MGLDTLTSDFVGFALVAAAVLGGVWRVMRVIVTVRDEAVATRHSFEHFVERSIEAGERNHTEHGEIKTKLDEAAERCAGDARAAEERHTSHEGRIGRLEGRNRN